MKLDGHSGYDITEEFFYYLMQCKENDLTFTWHRTMYSSIIYKNMPRLLYTRRLPIAIKKDIITNDESLLKVLPDKFFECIKYLNETFKDNILVIKSCMALLALDYSYHIILRFSNIDVDLQNSLKDYQGKEFEL
ncbi:MAG: hypothetical protein WC346_17865 [Methanogenium sp.]|jgi:hypothetical protein